MNRRNFLIATSALTIGVVAQSNYVFAQASKAAQATPSVATLINRSGRLRSLSQRTAKACAQLALGVFPDRSAEILNTAHRVLLGNLADLAASQPKADVSAQLSSTRSDVEKFIAATAPARATRANLADINRQAESVLNSAETLTALIEKASGAPTARIINLAGRQRLFSQRAAKAYFIHGASVESVAMAKIVTDSIAEFEAGMRTLSTASISNDRIQSELLLAQSQWAFFSNALNQPYSTNGARDVATTSERMLEIMDSLTSLYETALRDIVG